MLTTLASLQPPLQKTVFPRTEPSCLRAAMKRPSRTKDKTHARMALMTAILRHPERGNRGVGILHTARGVSRLECRESGISRERQGIRPQQSARMCGARLVGLN